MLLARAKRSSLARICNLPAAWAEGESGLAKEATLTVEGEIDEIYPDGRFGVMLDNQHRVIVYTAGKMRRFRIRSVVGDRVHVEMTPYDLTKGRLIFRERTPGQGPGSSPRRPGAKR
jgi:translation initiation factor IF-1